MDTQITHMNTARFATRLARLWALLRWLISLKAQFRRLSHATASEREHILRAAAQRGLDALNIRIQADLAPEYSSPKGYLLVSNHVSWLDILVVCALYPCGFIAKQEIKYWPIIGKMVADAGTVFINRQNRRDVAPINAAMAQALRQGQNVCFYPESRTSLGHNVLPLKAALFQAAIDAQTAVLPLALRYYDGQQRTDKVSFAHINLWQSVWQIVSIDTLTVRVNIAQPFDAAAIGNRFAIKDTVQTWLQTQIAETGDGLDA